ncbi:MAG: hypothetical protein R3F05_03805 [Planctomycetota bacterium]
MFDAIWGRRVRGALWALLAGLLVGACQSHSVPRRTTSEVDCSVAVYKELLRQACAEPETQLVVLDPELLVCDDGWSDGDRPRGLDPQAWRAFRAASRTGGHVPFGVLPAVKVTWLRSGDMEAEPGAVAPDDDWVAFRRRYPGNSGLIRLSRVGFSPDGRSAVVYGTVARGALSAASHLFVLRWTGSRWRIVRAHEFGIA